MTFRTLDGTTFVAGQIGPADMAAAAALGVTVIVNNRPDGEEAGQPPGAEIEASARAAGMGYRFIPVSGGMSGPQIDAMVEALESAEGKVLAFCRAGTRSTWLWALAQARRGVDGDKLIAQAAAAGYDLTPIRTFLP